jgi:arylsulfatase A-like enzyme
MLGDHNLWRKTYAYEGSTRIPFLIVPPGQLNGRRDGEGVEIRRAADEVVELRDVMPTLLEAVGLPVPSTVDGRSLLTLLQRPADEWRPYIHGEHSTCYSTEQEMQFVTDGQSKFVWLPRIGVEQFFDLEQDPGECVNLINEPNRQPARRHEIAQWRGYLVRELAARDCGWVREGALVAPPDEPLISPYKDVRWPGDRGTA